MKKTLYILSLFLLSFTTVSAQDCPIPETFSGNTGSNMTIMLTNDLITSLNVTSSDAYLVALSSDGSVVGSKEVAGVTLTSLPVWGDDSSTDEIDGALDGEAISFQLVDGELLFDVVMPTPVSYSTNNMVPQLAAAVLTDACTYDSPDPISYSIKAGWNIVAFIGDTSQTDVLTAMDAALENQAGTANTFQVIKNVNGKFWNSTFSTLNNFVPGEAYKMKVTGEPTSVNFQTQTGYIDNIEYQLIVGWNMVGFTGQLTDVTDIQAAMDAALENQAGTANTFQVIKNVDGKFWNSTFSTLNNFVPGEGYMMKVIGDPTTVNFQRAE